MKCVIINDKLYKHQLGSTKLTVQIKTLLNDYKNNKIAISAHSLLSQTFNSPKFLILKWIKKILAIDITIAFITSQQ
jgi:hypothetical protein